MSGSLLRGGTVSAVVLVVALVTLTGWGTLVSEAGPAFRANAHESCDAVDMPGQIAWCAPDDDDIPTQSPLEHPRRGSAGLANPALGKFLIGTPEDPLAAFSRRPFDNFIFPEGGLFLDIQNDGVHYGLDYANADDYLHGQITYFHPIGPGYVTARSTCVPCYVDGDSAGRVSTKWPRYNFGWGNLVVVETPYTPNVSIYVLYSHLARDFVSLGDYVTPEDIVGVVGSTGYSQQSHLHVEVRFGPPGQFWNADFTAWPTLDRWMATMFTNPAYLILPASHPAFLTVVNEWLAKQPPSMAIP